MLSDYLQKKLDQQISKKEQAQFIEEAVKEKLNQHIAINLGDKIELFTDGGARGNPGIAGGGFVIYKNGTKVLDGSEFFGHKTNNQSEYLALRLGLREAYQKFPEAKLDCYMDSELIVKQMRGEYKIKSVQLRPIYEEVRRIADQFKQFTIRHVDRSQNGVADALANRAMDLER